ncbi:hypothetical protein, partial [Moorena sp. SIO4A1]|uniref:hypothetical protein n=1 Tax=Moorena sp. SIO4A1 TaxID=2607835 RepID=UPI0025D22DC5
KKKFTSLEEWESAVAKIIKRYRTTGMFQIALQIKRVQKVKRRKDSGHRDRCKAKEGSFFKVCGIDFEAN